MVFFSVLNSQTSLFCLYRNKLECCHIKQSHICQFELRDHCKRHKAKCHDRLHFPTDSKFCISFLMNLCQFLVHPFPTSVTHQTCDRHRHFFDDFPFFYKDNAAFLFDQTFYRKRNLLITDTDCNNVMGIVGHGKRHRSSLMPYPFKNPHATFPVP